jgi:hypothetical protein
VESMNLKQSKIVVTTLFRSASSWKVASETLRAGSLVLSSGVDFDDSGMNMLSDH